MKPQAKLSLMSHHMNVVQMQRLAKKLWGDKKIKIEYQTDDGAWVRLRTFNNEAVDMPAWAFHLQQIILADDPSEYIRQNG